MNEDEYEGGVFGPALIALMQEAYAHAVTNLRSMKGAEQVSNVMLRRIASQIIDDVRDGAIDPKLIASNATRRTVARVSYLTGDPHWIEMSHNADQLIGRLVANEAVQSSKD